MAVVRNLMVRIGADFSEMSKGMQGATNRLNRFSRDTRRATNEIRGRKGIGGITDEFKNLGRTVTDSLSNIRGAKGIGGLSKALGGLKPALSVATGGLRGLGGAAGGAGVAVGALVGILAVLTAGLYAASQRAAKFEADIGRLNISLKEGARGYMEWAQAQGLAKETAADLGATYGNLLGSFISDTRQLQQSTQDLVHATRVIASYTGRSIDDVFNRIRSGMLGSTEAIEDLGVYVNISMIESTKAFKRFAGDKSWAQLDFQTQQQIRLAAILEQTYARYGNELQDTVLTRQEVLMEQFKDIKLHLSQAFLPIWDVVLPALAELASSLAYVTEQLARFMYWLRGWDYDERTRGIDEYTDSIRDTGNKMEELEDKAAKARSELAAFDRLNLLVFGKVESGGSTGGGTGGVDDPVNVDDLLPGERDLRGWSDLFYLWMYRTVRRMLPIRPRIKFDPPDPPDGGMGGVVSRITATVNQLSSSLRARYAHMWADLDAQTEAGLTGQLGRFGAFAPQFEAQWTGMLDNLLARLRSTTPAMQSEWQAIADSVRSPQPTLTTTRVAWDVTLRDMLTRLGIHVPQFELGWRRIGDAVRSVLGPLTEARLSWAESLQSMYSSAVQYVSGIVSSVQEAITALRGLRQESQTPSQAQPPIIPGMSRQPGTRPEPAAQPAPSPAPTPAPALSTAQPSDIFRDMLMDTARAMELMRESQSTVPTTPAPTTNRPAWVDETPVLGDIYRGLDWFRDVTAPIGRFAGQFAGGGGAGGVLGKGAQWLQRLLRGAVPAFASGGIVSGPTLAMVGEYAGAVNNPEVIAPLSDLQKMMGDSEQTAVLLQILRAIERGQHITVTVSEREIGRAAARYNNREMRQTGQSPYQW